MKKIIFFLDFLSSGVGKLSSFLIVILTISICFDITTRYLFNKVNLWAFDLTYMLYGVHAMLGAAYTNFHGGHVRMDLFYSRLDEKMRAIVDSICYLLLFFPVIIVLTWVCLDETAWSISRKERASSSIWRPQLGYFKAALTLGFVLLLLQGLSDFFKRLYTAVKGETYDS